MNIITIAKKAALEAVRASNPVEITYGTVIDAESLTIKVNEKLILPPEVLIVPERLIRYEFDLKHSHEYIDDIPPLKTTEEELLEKLIIRPGLKEGDKVLLLRVQGGQKYIVVDRVVTADDIASEQYPYRV